MIVFRWIGMALICGTPLMAQHAQAPIDIPGKAAKVGAASLDFHYQKAAISLVNTFGAVDEENRQLSHEFATLKANVPEGSYVIADGVRYNLLQFHFHQPSEHKLDGKLLPMEVHFVHLRADTQDSRTPSEGFQDCRKVDHPVLVVGAFIERGAGSAEMQKVFAPQSLPLSTKSAAVTVNGVDLGKVLPAGHGAVYYMGGLTAPSTTCNAATVASQVRSDVFPEIVRWYVLKDVARLPEAVMEKFHKLFEEGNSRPVQALNGRSVYQDPE